ncbi:MAG: TRAP transporter substrate-binding protein [Deltaproteobacteria bacterium]|nr:TRAP transporter substrate-binding protein [Deltaproteobacteria bacterium]MBW2153108.1 TRAP transporter substrate-binding protein [Deltaproteobacteria bacterium]
MKKRRIYWVSIVIVTVLLASFSVAPAEQAKDKPIELIFYWMLGKETLQYKGFQIMMKGIEERTKGRVKFKFFCCGSMGSDLESMEAMRMGSIDMRCMGVGTYARYHRPIDMIVMPFVFRDYDHVYKFVTSPLWYEITRGLEKSNIKPITNFNAGFRDIANNKRPVNSVSDVAGFKIRVPMISSWVTTWKAFGASPVAMKYTELYMALKTGVIDAQENGPNNFKDAKLYEVQKYFSYIKYAWLGPLLSMNMDKWNSLPKDIQQIIMEEAQKGAKWTFEMGEKMNDDALRWMEKEKGLIVNWNPDRESFRKASEKAYEGFRKKSWYDQAIIDQIRAIK